MKQSYFNRVSKWAARKIGKDLNIDPIYIAKTFFIPYFREGFKNYSRIEFDNRLKSQNGLNNLKVKGVYSFSFETKDFKPSNQNEADILVFRYSNVKGRPCTIRIIHNLKK